MARSSQSVKTRFGDGTISTVICDACGLERALADYYSPLEGWYRLVTVEAVGSYPKKVERDYCSKDCVVGTLVPDIYSSNPDAVLRAVGALKRIERDLDHRPEEASA